MSRGRSKSITTYRNAPFTPSDYPYLKHFWRMENAGTLVDCVAGVKWAPPVSVYDDDLQACLIGDIPESVSGRTRPYATAVQGDLHQIAADEHILLIGIGRTVAGTGQNDPADGYDTGHPVDLLRVAMGDFSNTGPSIGASNIGNTHPGYIGDGGVSGGDYYLNDSTTFPNNLTGNVGDDVAIYMTAERSGNIKCDVEKSDGTILVTPRYSATFQNPVAAPLGACSMQPYMHANGAKFYAIMLWAFPDGIPTDIDVAVEWMLNDCKNQVPYRRKPYPGWAGAF